MQAAATPLILNILLAVRLSSRSKLVRDAAISSSTMRRTVRRDSNALALEAGA